MSNLKQDLYDLLDICDAVKRPDDAITSMQDDVRFGEALNPYVCSSLICLALVYIEANPRIVGLGNIATLAEAKQNLSSNIDDTKGE